MPPAEFHGAALPVTDIAVLTILMNAAVSYVTMVQARVGAAQKPMAETLISAAVLAA